uniref:Uncharacterized protein n=1 Tax=Oreochromis niloticus TaxID=8128 RepID=A0A669CJY4_ORENI
KILLNCSSLQWFCDSAALDTEDSLEKQKVYKFRGDLAVRQGNYQVLSCLQWIADNNLTIRRDVMEGMARCCTRLGQRDGALELAQLLVILYLTGFSMRNRVNTVSHHSIKYYGYVEGFCSPYLKETEEASELSEDRVWLKAWTCFIRTRCSIESRATVCLHSFRQRWWNKILVTGLLETDGQQHKTQHPHAPVLTV